MEEAVVREAKNLGFYFMSEAEAGSLAKLLFKGNGTLSPDVVILDPPRKGCTPEVVEFLAKRNIKRIVYVSCDPKSLVRDLSVLQDKYVVKKVSLVDMFANTSHVESVVLLELKK